MRRARVSAPPPTGRGQRRPLAFSRLRTAHDSTLRTLVTASWDSPPTDPDIFDSHTSICANPNKPQTTAFHTATATAPAPAPAPATDETIKPTPDPQPPATSLGLGAGECSMGDDGNSDYDAIHHLYRSQQLRFPLPHPNYPPLSSSLPPRAATDVSGAALHAARIAEIAAREAADASAAARAAASYARTLIDADRAARAASVTGTAPTSVPESSSAMYPPNLADESRGHTSIPPVPPHTAKPRAIVRPVPLGKSWNFNLVALTHNAIRMEMRDLDDIVWGLVDNPRPANIHELSAFFAWFSTFEAFVITYLKAEEEVLFPWIEQWGRIEGNLSTAARITTKGTIIRGIRDTAACAALVGLDAQLPDGMVLTNPHRNYYDSLNVGMAEVQLSVPQHNSIGKTAMFSSIIHRVATYVEAFSATMLEYFQEQERNLPTIIDSLYDEEDMHTANIERRMIRAIWKCGCKDESMVILMRAVEDAPFYRQWVQRNLRRVERFTMSLWKRRYCVGRGAVTAKFRQRHLFRERHTGSLDATHPEYSMEDLQRATPPQLSGSAHLSLANYRLSQARSIDTDIMSMQTTADPTFQSGQYTLQHHDGMQNHRSLRHDKVTLKT